MGLVKKNVLGIGVTTSTKDEILEEIGKYLKELRTKNLELRTKKVKPLIIFTPNPEIIVYAQKDDRFKRIVNSAQISISDGIGVSWAIKKLYGIEIERLSGADLMEDLCFWASESGARIGLIGGRGGVALQALECLRKKYPKLNGWAMDGPEIKVQSAKCKVQSYSSNFKVKELSKDIPPGAGWRDLETTTVREVKKVVNKIVKEKTDILFIALGFPKQEYFIAQLARTLNQEPRTKNKGQVLSSQSLVHSSAPLVLMAVGGSFDYLAGRTPRAPRWVRNRGLEWLYRLIREPWRLSRQLKGAEFFLRAFWDGVRVS